MYLFILYERIIIVINIQKNYVPYIERYNLFMKYSYIIIIKIEKFKIQLNSITSYLNIHFRIRNTNIMINEGNVSGYYFQSELLLFIESFLILKYYPGLK